MTPCDKSNKRTRTREEVPFDEIDLILCNYILAVFLKVSASKREDGEYDVDLVPRWWLRKVIKGVRKVLRR